MATFLGARQADLADAAAMIALVDLVITIDTSIANLAGAMGKPTWVLLPFSATGGGWWGVRTVPGIRARGCSASPPPATGTAWSPRSCKRYWNSANHWPDDVRGGFCRHRHGPVDGDRYSSQTNFRSETLWLTKPTARWRNPLPELAEYSVAEYAVSQFEFFLLSKV
jgi:hypothetical protein